MICGRFNRCSVAQGSLSALNRDRNLLFVPPLLWANYCLVDLSLNIFTCKTRALNLSTGASVPLSRNKSNNGWNRIGKEWVMSRKCLAHCATWNEGLNCKLSKWTITLTSRLHWKCLRIYWISSHKKFRRERLLLYSFCSWRNQAMIC